MSEKIVVKGERDLIQALRKYSGNVRKSVQKIMGDESKDFLKSLKDETPVNTGALKKAFGRYTVRTDDSGVRIIIGVRSGEFTVTQKKKRVIVSTVTKVPAQYAHVVEKKRGFATRCFNENSDNITKTIFKRLRELTN
jgi:hypothetical protein